MRRMITTGTGSLRYLDRKQRHRPRGLVRNLACLCLVVACGACGGDSGSSEVDTGAQIGIDNVVLSSFATAAVAAKQGGGSAVTLETVANVETTRGLTVYPEDADPLRVKLPFNEPLFTPFVWATAESVGVFGVRCAGIDPAQFESEEDSFPTAQAICGRTEYDFFRYQLGDRKWSEPATLGSFTSDATLLGSGEATVVWAFPPDASDGEPSPSRGAEAVVVDVNSGDVTAFTPPAADIESICPAGSAGLLAVRSALASGGSVSDDGVASADSTSSYIAYTSRVGGDWAEVAIEGQVASVEGCVEDGFVWRDGKGALYATSVDDDDRTSTVAMGLPTDQPSVLKQSINLEIVVLEDDSENNDGPTAERIWVLRNREWVSLGSETLASGDTILAAAGTAIVVPAPDELFVPIVIEEGR